MKKVIFVCLLTLSVCLSDTTVKPVEAPKPANETAPAGTPTLPPPVPAQGAPAANESKPKEPEKPAQNNTTAQDGTNTPVPVPTNASTINTNNTTERNVVNTTTTAPTLKPPARNDTKITTVKPNAPTEAPHAPTEQPRTLQARRFDGASFVGGMVLTLGLLAIGFMGFKYYKAQTERNYHTL